VIGGGQSFFGDLIRANPSVHFSYFATEFDHVGRLPPNATALPLTDRYRHASQALRIDPGVVFDGVSLAGAEGDILLLFDMAASSAGLSFDVLEIPDFLPFAALLPHALHDVGARIGRVVLSLHGTLTHALAGNWAPDEMFDLDRLRAFESILFKSVDLRYGIGRPYLCEWEERTGFAGHLLDVSTVFDFGAFSAARRRAQVAWPAATLPDIVYVGRHDRCKGPDLFVELAGSLSRDSYGSAILVGPSVELAGHASRPALTLMAERRKIELTFDRMSRVELIQRYTTSPWLVLLPSRRDTFNLACLEALLSGCPTAISSATGVSAYLDEVFPDLPCLRIDPNDLGASRESILFTLGNYANARRDLSRFLDEFEPRRVGATIQDIWRAEPSSDLALVASLKELVGELFSRFEGARGGGPVAKRLQDDFAARIAATIDTRDSALASTLKQLPPQLVRFDALRAGIVDNTGDRFAMSDGRLKPVTVELGSFLLSGNRVGVFNMLADLEGKRGNDLLYATYKIRALRLSNVPSPAPLLDTIERILIRHGFPKEAQVVRWLHGPEQDAVIARQYLDGVRARFSTCPRGDIEAVADHRTSDMPKATIIVSMYRAGNKIPAFLRGLSRMTEQTRRTCEIVLVDSHSPDDTQEGVARELERLARDGRPLNLLYVRTSVRETIQRAWNRGIALARADYIAFLGVDEMNRPDAFDIMIDYLDRHPYVDWVQGTALVTEVDMNGSFLRDLMAYDRTFDNDVVQLLDTCFIGYVGALYRKAIHDRAGFYDDSFRGAGDTEFKNRALPFMNVVTLPTCLGFFLNYPEERVTASPAVEIEDLRAWYLHRSAAGMGYHFDNGRIADARDLARKCLHYRKSYLDQDSTDLELAAVLNSYLLRVSPDVSPELQDAAACSRSALSAYRTLDNLDEVAGDVAGIERDHRVRCAVEGVASRLSGTMAILRATGWDGAFWVRNDNRSHQHFDIWPSTLQSSASSPVSRAVRRPEAEETEGVAFPFIVSPALSFDIVVNSTPAVRQDLRCRVDGRALPAPIETNGSLTFTRPGRPSRTTSWDPHIDFVDEDGAPVLGVDAALVVDLVGITDQATGDRALSVENLHYVEHDPSGRAIHRWTGPGLTAKISVPVASSREGRLEITIANPGANAFSDVEVSVNGQVTRLLPDHEGWMDGNTIALPLPANLASGSAVLLEVGVTARRTKLSGSDAREIGVAWSRARLAFPFQASA
jgi:glycosyltransferase involved in cell wall biosynthesis